MWLLKLLNGPVLLGAGKRKGDGWNVCWLKIGLQKSRRRDKLNLLFVEFFFLVYALDSAARSFFSSSLSLAISSGIYSSTVDQPVGDLSTILISLFLLCDSPRMICKRFLDLVLPPDSISFNVSSISQ